MENIRIAIYGQIDNDTKFGYTYPDKFDPTHNSKDDEWLRSVVDPRETRVFRLSRVYTIWKNHLGNYYAVTVPNRNDTRNGLLSLVIFTGKYIIGSGKSALEALRQLEEILINRQAYDNHQVGQVTEGLKKFLVPDFKNELTDLQKDRKAFRTYANDTELMKILQYPNQQDYNEYKRIFIVEGGRQYTVEYGEIRKPMTESFIIRNPYPDQVKVNVSHVQKGGTFEAVYFKPGFEPFRKNITVMPGSDDVQLNAIFCILKKADELGIKFSRKLTLKFVSQSGTPITGVKCQTGRQTVLSNENGVCSLSIMEGQEHNVQVTARHANYADADFAISDVEHGKVYEFKLKPKDYKLVLKIGNNRIPTEIALSQTSQLFRTLKNEYNAIVHPGEVVLSVTRPSDINSGLGGRKPKDDEWKELLLRIGKMAAAALLAFYIVYAAFAFIRGNKPWPFNPSKQLAVVDSTEIDGGEDIEDVDDIALAEQDDIRYLKEEDIWEVNMIKSEKYKALYHYLSEGNISAILGEDWFAESEQNKYFEQVRESLNKINRLPNARERATQEMQRVFKNKNNINLIEIVNNLREILRGLGNNKEKEQLHQQRTSSPQRETSPQPNRPSQPQPYKKDDSQLEKKDNVKEKEIPRGLGNNKDKEQLRQQRTSSPQRGTSPQPNRPSRPQPVDSQPEKKDNAKEKEMTKNNNETTGGGQLPNNGVTSTSNFHNSSTSNSPSNEQTKP